MKNYSKKWQDDLNIITNKVVKSGDVLEYGDKLVDLRNRNSFILDLGKLIYEDYKNCSRLTSSDVFDYTKDIIEVYQNNEPDFSKGWTAANDIDKNGNLIIEKNNYEKKIALGGSFLISDYPFRKGVSVEAKSYLYSSVKKVMHIGPAANYEDDSFLFITGKTFLDNLNDSSSNVRFYFNFNPEVEAFRDLLLEFIDLLVKKINERHVPFIFKVIRFKSKFDRADSGVLYINNRHYHALTDLIWNIHEKYKDIFRKTVPLFTYEFKEGIGLAEQPFYDYNENLYFTKAPSFGEYRSRLIARVIFDLIEKNEYSPESVYGNLELYQPFYLNRLYNKKLEGTYFNFSTIYESEENVTFSKLLAVEKVANILYSEAIFDYWGRCNWICSAKSGNKTLYNTLDTDLLGGLGGIVLFIHHLRKINDSKQHKIFYEASSKTLLNKIKDRYYFTEKKLVDFIPRIRGGYFKGDLMGMYVLLLSDPDLYEREEPLGLSKRLTQKLIVDENDLSLWSGISGSIVSFCKLYEVTNNEIFIERAMSLADKFLINKDMPDIGVSMKNGRSGMALSLAVLYRNCSKERYKRRVIEILKYDQGLKASNPQNLWDKTKYGDNFEIEFGWPFIDIHLSRKLLMAWGYMEAKKDLEATYEQIRRTDKAFLAALYRESAFNYLNAELFPDMFKGDLEIYENLADFNSFKVDNFNPTVNNGLAGIGLHLIREYHMTEDKRIPKIYDLLEIL